MQDAEQGEQPSNSGEPADSRGVTHRSDSVDSAAPARATQRTDCFPGIPDAPAPATATTPASAAKVLEPLAVPTKAIIRGGLLCWVIALAAILAIPALHTGDRSWWPWACVSGLALGGIGYAYVARGRGNAADAE